MNGHGLKRTRLLYKPETFCHCPRQNLFLIFFCHYVRHNLFSNRFLSLSSAKFIPQWIFVNVLGKIYSRINFCHCPRQNLFPNRFLSLSSAKFIPELLFVTVLGKICSRITFCHYPRQKFVPESFFVTALGKIDSPMNICKCPRQNLFPNQFLSPSSAKFVIQSFFVTVVGKIIYSRIVVCHYPRQNLFLAAGPAADFLKHSWDHTVWRINEVATDDGTLCAFVMFYLYVVCTCVQFLSVSKKKKMVRLLL